MSLLEGLVRNDHHHFETVDQAEAGTGPSCWRYSVEAVAKLGGYQASANGPRLKKTGLRRHVIEE